MVVASVIWGSTFIVGRVAVQFIDPLFIAFFENLVGLVVLAIALRRSDVGLGWNESFSLLREPRILLLGILNGLAYALQYYALSLTTAINTSLLVNLGLSIAIPIFAVILGKEKLSVRRIVALIMGFIGALLIITNGDLSILSEGAFIGDMLSISIGVIWALWVIVAHDIMKSETQPLRVVAPNTVYTVVLLGIITLVFSNLQLSYLTSIEAIAAIVYLGVFSIGLAYVLYYDALKTIGGTGSAIYLLLQSVVTMIMGVILLGELLTLIMLSGVLLVLIAILFAD